MQSESRVHREVDKRFYQMDALDKRSVSLIKGLKLAEKVKQRMEKKWQQHETYVLVPGLCC